MEAGRQAGLSELTRAMLGGAALAALMEQGLALVAQTLGAARVAVWELLPGEGALALRAALGWDDAAAGPAPARVEAGSAYGAAMLGAAPVLVGDWAAEAGFEQPQPLRERGVLSSLAVAIPGPQGPFGSLSVDDSAGQAFGSAEAHFLQQVAGVLGLAIERDHARQVLERHAGPRTGGILLRLSALAQEQAVREERQRIARDLHDSVIQALYSVTLHVQGARLLLAAGEVALVAEALRGLQDTAQEALDELRLLIFDLRPPLLDQVGLVAAIKARLTAVEGRSNLQARLVADHVGALPAPVEQALYRIAQEALNNALKHARAGQITLELRREAGRLALEIADDGAGFDPAAAHETGGVGLRGIAERVAGVGGAFALESAPGEGTRLRVEVPL